MYVCGKTFSLHRHYNKCVEVRVSKCIKAQTHFSKIKESKKMKNCAKDFNFLRKK
jgi:hypothetical protein